MHLVDRIIEYLIQKCLDEPVVAHHFDRSLPPRGG
jgi:hypothetical protein